MSSQNAPKNVIKYCLTRSACPNHGNNNLATSGNDPTVTKKIRYGQYVKTTRSYNVPVKTFFGYDASGNSLTKNQTLAQAYGLGIRFV